MADVFLSYARATEPRIAEIGGALEGSGYSLWWDKALNASDDYAMVIEAELDAAACVVVAWSAPARRSLWVRAEANEALDSGKLVQINLDGTSLPLPFNVLHFLDFSRWRGERQGLPWSEFDARVGALLRGERMADAIHLRARAAGRPGAAGLRPDRMDRLGGDRAGGPDRGGDRRGGGGRDGAGDVQRGGAGRARPGGDPARARRLRPDPHQPGLAAMSGPTNRRFVRSAWTLLAFQFVAAGGAVALAIWAATSVQHLVDQRDLLQARVTTLEAHQSRPAGDAAARRGRARRDPPVPVAPAPARPAAVDSAGRAAARGGAPGRRRRTCRRR